MISLLASLTTTAVHAVSEIEETLTISNDYRAEINVDETSYIRGSVEGDKSLAFARIVDSQGRVVKTIIDEGLRDGEIFWLATTPGKYILEVVTQEKENQIKVVVEEKSLKSDQSVNPNESPISPKLIEVSKSLSAGIEDAEKLFWQQIALKGTPLIEPNHDGSAIVTFLWRGDEHNVRLFGAPYDGHVYLSRLKNSDIWHKSYQVPNGSRLSYRMAPNVPQLSGFEWIEQRRAVLATAQTDPLNIRPKFVAANDKFGDASTMEYGNVFSDQYTLELGSAQGQVESYQLASDILNNTRSVKVYLPHQKYQVAKDAPLLIVFDGDQYLSRVPTPTILDNLIAAKKIPPLRAIFINHPTSKLRGTELPPNSDFAEFMATELIPWVKQTFQIAPPANKTILTGSSYGGLASMYVAHQYPAIFGNVLSQSGSFWWAPSRLQKEWLTKQISQSPENSLKIYMNAGLFEQKPDRASIIDTNRKLYQVLQEKHYDVKFDELASGHDYYSWRVTIANGLDYLFQ
ncbi:alpha/beta hydrolase-fold protein [Vibrio fluminensis]|uniref:alpha/beta hydrolase-fold protein n=1 Tax=Vibrio fluminensis TaxID=2783614 RepID=UPI0018881602